MLFKSAFTFILVGLVAGVLFVQCTPMPDKTKSKINFTVGLEPLGLSRGHEDLTRFAVDLVNAKIKQELNLNSFYPAVPVGENGAQSNYPMIQGVYHTDFAVSHLPPHEILSGKLIGYYGAGFATTASEWQDTPWLQSIHSLRDFSGGEPLSLDESLKEIRNKIANAAYFAVGEYNGHPYEGHYWLGHILHIIQDSFSEAHTRRGTDLRAILDVCTYGVDKRAAGICMHPHPVGSNDEERFGATLEKERIWRSDVSGCDLNPVEHKWHCLKPSAQKAAEVSAGFLFHFAKVWNGSTEKDKLNAYGPTMEFLTSNSLWHGGYFNGEWESVK